MQSTALIIRPENAPEIRVLECDGPKNIAKIHHCPRTFDSLFMSFEEFLAMPHHVTESRERSGQRIAYESAQRIIRLLDQLAGNTPQATLHLQEIRWRVLILQPGCDSQF